MSKERPILFSGPMVRALLNGSKTQTRRVCKPAANLSAVIEVPDPLEYGQVYNGSHFGDEDGEVQFACPYGGRGDRLWVRESWQVARETLDYETGGEYDVWAWDEGLGDPRKHLKGDARFGTKSALFYAADGEDKNPSAFFDLLGLDNKTVLRTKEINWRPSIHMPRWASRITLEITSVRVERLQEISEADALAEGITYGPTCDEEGRSGGYHWDRTREDEEVWPTAAQAYKQLWESINGPDSWTANPWVWAIEFRRLP